MVRASLDRAGRKRAMREVMATIRRFPRLALYPAMTMDGLRQGARRIGSITAAITQNATQLASTAGEHLSGIAVTRPTSPTCSPACARIACSA
jgi:hypothetical protein